MQDIVQTAINNGHFKTLITALRETDLYDILSTDGPFTLFAPTDEAFAQLTKKQLDTIFTDKETLTHFLTNHITTNTNSTTTVNGTPITIKNGHTHTINGITITHTNIKCTNGTIHIINQVLLPKN